MTTAVILTILMPFIPTFFLGDVFVSMTTGTKANIEQAACSDKDQNTCSFNNKEDNNGKVASAQDNSNTEKNYNQQYMFPTDAAQSLTAVPEKTGNSRDIKLWATSSVSIDADTGTILHYENGKKKTQIASLTKMMTATLIMEKIKDLNEEVVITREALNVPGTVVGCPRSGFCPSNRLYLGEKVKAIDLLKAMLMNSANDAATALGVYIAGSTDKFVQMMNDKAKELGFNDTNFCTPSGLETDGMEDQCYSTAYDIARIAAYSLKYDKIWEIMRTPEDKIYSCDGKYMHQLKNTDLLLGSITNCLGGKTGFTPLAGKSLLLGSTDPSGQHKVISVILNDEKRWEDMEVLNNWIFANYNWKQ